jgi:DnaJ-class molecular chaperone
VLLVQPALLNFGLVPTMKTCPDCNGDGVVDKDTDDERQCSTCGGRGFVPDDADDHEEVIKVVRGMTPPLERSS